MVTVERDGSLTFRVYLPQAQSVELVGDFTGWSAGRVPLAPEIDARGEGGWWKINCRCPCGDHAFSYLVDDHWWFPDYAAHGVQRNEYGNWTSLLVVPPPTAKPRPHAARIDREHPRRRAAAETALESPSSRWDAIRAMSATTAAAMHPSAG